MAGATLEEAGRFMGFDLGFHTRNSGNRRVGHAVWGLRLGFQDPPNDREPVESQDPMDRDDCAE